MYWMARAHALGSSPAAPTHGLSVRFAAGLSQDACQRALEQAVDRAVSAHLLPKKAAVEPVFPGDRHPRRSVMFIVQAERPTDSLVEFLSKTGQVEFVQVIADRSSKPQGKAEHAPLAQAAKMPREARHHG